MEARVDEVFGRFNEETPGAALAVIKDGQVVYKKGYGTAQLEYGAAIGPDTVFHVASVSKQFTAFAILLLAEEGKLSLDDDIREYLPEVGDLGKTITIRHLVHHTSGLRDQWVLLRMAGWRMDDVITTEHILKLVQRQQELNFEPGAEHLYCNTGYTLLAEIVARVSGQSFREWTAEHIFEPLGMTNTHFHDDHEMIVKNRAYSYRPVRDQGYKKAVLSFANVGATSLFTTAEDLAQWLLNFEEKKVGSAGVFEQMHKQGILNNAEEINYAFALNIGEYKGLKTVGHSGSDAGFRSYAARFPQQRFGVVVLSNVSNSNPSGLARQVADIYLADEITEEEPRSRQRRSPETKEQEPITLSEEELAEYAGYYLSEELDTTYRFIVREGQLTALHQRHSDISMRVNGEDEFRGGVLGTVRFTRNKENQIDGFRATSGRVRNLRFDKFIFIEEETTGDSG
ncbi:MAG: hypothetical protein AMJ79_11345 [Phycisphaerae bacterium SM23_30]|nr:MAG: hypothetical protein AMJ79_11345 [Phycisphaerae bacterium SM23_30]